MDDVLKISVIIPTKERPKDLTELLLTILEQNYRPFEIIIVDDSLIGSAKKTVDIMNSEFEKIGCPLKYVSGGGDGLTASRNLGVTISNGDVVLFLDDDTLLDQDVLIKLIRFLKNNPGAKGVQPLILPSKLHVVNKKNNNVSENLENAIYKVLMLSYCEENKLNVRRSGFSVFPSIQTKPITAQRLSGCCCYRRELFNEFLFDTNLKKWGFMEDLDFSNRVFRKYPGSLYAIPNTIIFHKASKEARLPTKTATFMIIIYWVYIFFKNMFQGSILNLIAFLWALAGILVGKIGGLIFKRKSLDEWWGLIYLLEAYATTIKHFKDILMGNLDFFNNELK